MAGDFSFFLHLLRASNETAALRNVFFFHKFLRPLNEKRPPPPPKKKKKKKKKNESGCMGMGVEGAGPGLPSSVSGGAGCLPPGVKSGRFSNFLQVFLLKIFFFFFFFRFLFKFRNL